MALVVEDGTGLANAESYASVADATTYATDRELTAWTAGTVTDANREAALRRATEYIEAEYGQRFAGVPLTTTQALHFPLEGATAVPVGIQRATIELAIIALSGALYTVEDAARQVVSQSRGVGPLQTSVTYRDTDAIQRRYRQVDKLVAPYLRDRGLQLVVRRA